LIIFFSGPGFNVKISVLKSKIHRASVTRTAPDYEGSITVDQKLLAASGICEYEKVLVADVNNGRRFETYCLSSPEEGLVCVNGAAARLVTEGDLIIIMAFALIKPKKAAGFRPKVLLVDSNNRPLAEKFEAEIVV
jgi:aspartate 1-decarboxylase